MTEPEDQVVKPPKSTDRKAIEQLGYVESFDAIVDKDYAYCVFRETDTASGKWVMRIKGNVTVSTIIDPNGTALKGALKKARGHDETELTWGFTLKPKEGDPRLVENKILLSEEGKPTALEIHVVTRKKDGSAREQQTLTVPWPTD